MELGKYSFGIGDRFAKQGIYQLRGFKEALTNGVMITPVWNKSFREHKIVGSAPGSVRNEADQATTALGWYNDYFVDADHITMDTVGLFTDASDFFTLDVANKINTALGKEDKKKFYDDYKHLIGQHTIDGLKSDFFISQELLMHLGDTYLKAVEEAKLIYDTILQQKRNQEFVVEVSMDEVANPQSPIELYFILYLLSAYKVPVNTIAPKFIGRFNKGIDYEGDSQAFEKEFEQHILLVKHAIKHFNLSGNLKLSVHTGSDKFSLYPIINRLIKKHDVGLHLKTAGTTWLEELIGLAEAESESLLFAKSIYEKAMLRFDELTGPYETVLSIDQNKLPAVEDVSGWSGADFSKALKHQPQENVFNPHFRQLLHTAYKIAAEQNYTFLRLVKANRDLIGHNVYENIYFRHLRPLFLG